MPTCARAHVPWLSPPSFTLQVNHAYLVLGPPSSSRAWLSYFNTIAYEAGGDIFSLSELEHCIIRANRWQPNPKNPSPSPSPNPNPDPDINPDTYPTLYQQRAACQLSIALRHSALALRLCPARRRR